MPWVQIPPENLAHLSLFGYDLVGDDEEFAWYTGPRGRMRVKKSAPRVWVEDITDAIQIGALAILIHSEVED